MLECQLFAEEGTTGGPKLPIEATVPRFGYRGWPRALARSGLHQCEQHPQTYGRAFAF